MANINQIVYYIGSLALLLVALYFMQKGPTDKYSSANLVLKEKEREGALLLGDCNSAVDNHFLKPHKIKTILTFGTDAFPENKNKDINYKLYNVLDNKTQKILDIVDEVYTQIEQSRSEGGVLLHCYTGISRSPSFAIAYLMRKRRLTYDEAKKFLLKQRAFIHPSDNFHRQLQQYEKILQRRREEEEAEALKSQEQEAQQMGNQNLSNCSNLSKRTTRGVKGAVKCALRSPSLEEKREVEIERSPMKEYLQLTKVEKESAPKKNEVKGVYSAKTKVV